MSRPAFGRPRGAPSDRGHTSRGGRPGAYGGGGGVARPAFHQRNDAPPDTVLELGTFLHAVEDEMLCLTTLQEKVPYFNAPIYLQNKTPIGKVDEILGPINQVYFSIKVGQGIVASSFKNGEKVYIAPDKILPLERFLPKPKPPHGEKRGRGSARGAAGARGRGRGGPARGGSFFGRGRGAPRGGGAFARGRGGDRGRGRGAPRGYGGGGRGGGGGQRFTPY